MYGWLVNVDFGEYSLVWVSVDDHAVWLDVLVVINCPNNGVLGCVFDDGVRIDSALHDNSQSFDGFGIACVGLKGKIEVGSTINSRYTISVRIVRSWPKAAFNDFRESKFHV